MAWSLHAYLLGLQVQSILFPGEAEEPASTTSRRRKRKAGGGFEADVPGSRDRLPDRHRPCHHRPCLPHYGPPPSTAWRQRGTRIGAYEADGAARKAPS